MNWSIIEGAIKVIEKIAFFIVVTAVVALAALLFATVAFGEITGDTVLEAGKLATFQSDTPGLFQLVPTRSECLASDSDGKKCYFASPEAGTYYLVFTGIRDNAPILEIFPFEVTQSGILPTPTPQPIIDVTDLTDREKTVLVTAMQAVIAGMESHVVQTPQHARMEFKRLVTTQLHGTVSNAMNDRLRQWTDENKITTLDEIKATFQKLIGELK